jgi:hypothetical protein
MDTWVQALTVYSGELIAGGLFTTAGGVAANNIAAWDGFSWSTLGSGMNSRVTSLTIYDGQLIAGGFFTAAGGVAADYIALWEGSVWLPLGSGMNSYVRSLSVYDGELIAAGDFTTAGGGTASRIARWSAPYSDTDGDSDPDWSDPDDDNDGVADASDIDPLNPNICADVDDDLCDDCSVGVDGFGPLADNFPNNDGTDTDADGICDAGECRPYPPQYDTLSTPSVKLVVSDQGNFAREGAPGVTLDYHDQGDCEEVYAYDGTPVIVRFSGGEYRIDHCMDYHNTFLRPHDGNPIQPVTNLVDHEFYSSGTFVTSDGALAIEKTYYAPQHPDTSSFMVQGLKVYSRDGGTHENVALGEAIDWDIPSSPSFINVGGASSTSKLIYLQGEGTGCAGTADNSRRFGGQSLIGIAYSNATCVDTSVAPANAHTRLRDVDIRPTGSFVAEDVYNLMQQSGYYTDASAADQYTLMTFVNGQTIGPDDTIYVYSALTSVYSGTSDDVAANASAAKAWFIGHVCSACGGPTSCCIGRVGDANNSGEDEPTISDISVIIDAKFITGTCGGDPPKIACLAEADTNQSGGADPTCDDITISDISTLIDYLFITGPGTATLPECL